MRILGYAALSVLGCCLTARADLLYTVGGATFTLPSNPTPSALTTDGFILNNVSVQLGVSTYSETVVFSDASGCYSFFLGNAGTTGDCSRGEIYTAGAEYMIDQTQPLFSGPLSSPTLLPGTFTGTVGYSTIGTFPLVATVAVPEPAAFLLLGSGLLSVVGVARRNGARPSKTLPEATN